MTERTADEIRAAVSAAYGARAEAVAAGRAAHDADSSGCCGESGCSCDSDDGGAAGLRQALYGAEQASLPETVVSYGCGNPLALAGLRTGEVVLDLGSGAGLDCFLAGERVGPTGRVIGLDMTDAMLALAEQNRARLGAPNVEFHKGVMEAMPVAGASVDVIISNCVINLSPDKDAVFHEAARVLRPGGRLHVSDVVLLHALAAAEQADLDLWAGCISGALVAGDYAARLTAAGFIDVTIDLAETDGAEAAKPWRSALITARLPGGSGTLEPARWHGERIELLAPAGLATAACCATDDEACDCEP